LKLQRNDWLLALGAALSVGGYLLASHLTLRVGFPLDDAWIHQTYARNLALWGEWSFWRGQVSGGSTAPLWSFLLVLGYLLKLAPYSWTFLLGALLLWALAALGERFLRQSVPAYRASLPWMGFFLLGEWHLVWAAASGMETLLYALIVTVVLLFLALGKRNYLFYGALIGLSLWVRPGGVTLLGPVVVVIFFSGQSIKKNLKDLLGLGLSFGIFLAFYFLFNLLIAGTPYPNTFYAKQAEYAILREIPLWTRFLREISLPFIGAGALLLPGLFFYGWQALRRREVGALVGMIWFVGYAALYAWKLPVTYQHGRYMIPAIPILIVWGFAGTFQLFGSIPDAVWGNLTRFGSRFVLALVCVAFYGLGARSYALDVAVIETEMVTTAKWVNAHLPADALVAAHDIGALGYFDGRELVDLAGLVSPDVIPFIRDEEKLAAYLNQQGVDYLIVFPLWYATLSEGLPLVYNTSGLFANTLGGENMVIYRWIK